MSAMSRQMLEVMQRRGELLAKIASQREQIAATGMRWKAPLEIADKGIAVVRFLRSNPVLVAAAVAIFATRRRGVIATATIGWKMWRRYNSAKLFSAKLASQLRH